jgi:hypothetical protein
MRSPHSREGREPAKTIQERNKNDSVGKMNRREQYRPIPTPLCGLTDNGEVANTTRNSEVQLRRNAKSREGRTKLKTSGPFLIPDKTAESFD